MIYRGVAEAEALFRRLEQRAVMEEGACLLYTSLLENLIDALPE